MAWQQRVWEMEVPQWGPGAKPQQGTWEEVPWKLKRNVKLINFKVHGVSI